ncbi:collagen-like protein [Pseudomonas sp. UL073]|uniref:Collagen-like protein n=1 Tax=Zestomonas insulae TaxID=2809017 RepID=A0ABS2IBM2_9GAMM|nr:collagen-like protein [Pseudomonas insulae]MBM7060501.1 collagen-like protein [Pseudomonas insulae]
MRSLAVFALFCSSLACADATVVVAPHTLLRLPATTGLLVLDRLEVGHAGALLIPSTVNELRVGELLLGQDARIGIAPSAEEFRLEARHAELAAGSQISARGATGTAQKPATAGRNLSVRLEQASLSNLTLDVRGGVGAPGFAGLDGGSGHAGGCLWGQVARGADGQNGADGQSGGAGGQVRLEVPADFPADSVKVRLDGGAGGEGGMAGQGGRGSSGKGCLLYRTEGARDGRAGQAGHAGAQGGEGSFKLVRFAPAAPQ